MPALVSLFGRWNWWLPGGLARVLRVEPSPVAPAAEPAEEPAEEPGPGEPEAPPRAGLEPPHAQCGHELDLEDPWPDSGRVNVQTIASVERKGVHVAVQH